MGAVFTRKPPKMCEKSKLNTIDVVAIIGIVLTCWLMLDYVRIQSDIEKEADSLNNTKFANQSLMIFNRVPKAGTETLWGLIDVLAYLNNFTVFQDNADLKDMR